MLDIMGNALIAGLTWIGGILGLELFEMLVLLAAISGTWLFLLRAQMYVALAQSRKRHQRKQRQQQGSPDQKQQQATTDDVKPTSPALATADADDDDDPPLLRQQAPNVHRVAVQPSAAPSDAGTDKGDDDGDAGDHNDAPWLNRTGPVSDPRPPAQQGTDDDDPDNAAAVADAVTVTGVAATGDRLLALL
jgi:hypothetical protein